MSLSTQTALTYFKQHDPVMHVLLKRALHSTLALKPPLALPPEQYFERLVHSIIGQQISTKAADAVRGRVDTFVGNITPQSLLAVDPVLLKQCGLSQQKTSYLLRNAEIWHSLPIHDFKNMDDESIIIELTKLYGIGRWTAEMFLIFSMARPDVFSYGDLGLRESLYAEYDFKPHYVRKIADTVQNWSPYQTTASLTLWHARDSGSELQ